MSSALSAILQDYYLSRGKPAPDELVFPNRHGQPRDRANLVERDFKSALTRAAVRQVSFHALRHTFASLCIAAGMDPKAIQRAMGHSTINITMDTYGHLFAGAYDHALARVDALLTPDTNLLFLHQQAEG
jgi:integrase